MQRIKKVSGLTRRGEEGPRRDGRDKHWSYRRPDDRQIRHLGYLITTEIFCHHLYCLNSTHLLSHST